MKKILVLGGAHIDRRGMIETETVQGASNPGSWMEEPAAAVSMRPATFPGWDSR